MRNTIAKRYSKGLFDLAKERNLIDDIAADCQAVLQAFESNPSLTSFLQNPKIQKKDKELLIENAFKSNVNQYTYDFIRLLTEKGRIQFLRECAQYFLVLTDVHKGLIDVDVTSALELSAAQMMELQKKLEQSTSKKVNINRSIDPTILGGMIIKIGNKVIDGSIRTKISKIKESLLKAQVMEVEVRE